MILTVLEEDHYIKLQIKQLSSTHDGIWEEQFSKFPYTHVFFEDQVTLGAESIMTPGV